MGNLETRVKSQIPRLHQGIKVTVRCDMAASGIWADIKNSVGIIIIWMQRYSV